MLLNNTDNINPSLAEEEIFREVVHDDTLYSNVTMSHDNHIRHSMNISNQSNNLSNLFTTSAISIPASSPNKDKDNNLENCKEICHIQAEFGQKLRGYDPIEVDEVLDQAVAEIQRLSAELKTANDRSETAESILEEEINPARRAHTLGARDGCRNRAESNRKGTRKHPREI